MGRHELCCIGVALARMTEAEHETLRREVDRRLRPLIGKRINDRTLETVAEIFTDEIQMIVAGWD